MSSTLHNSACHMHEVLSSYSVFFKSIMWASKPRYQARMASKINSLHWIDGTCSDCSEETVCRHAGGGWILFGGTKGELGVSWIGRGDGNGSIQDNIFRTQNGSMYKSHFNMRGHAKSGGVKFVRWKPQGDKFVSYDNWGNVCVWRNRSNIFALDFEFTTATPVSDIQWSPCGTYISLCGEEGQLQVITSLNGGTVFALHAFSTTAYSAYAEFTSLSWNSSSTRIALGTQKGEVIEVDPHQNGQFLTMMTMHRNVSVRQVEYFSSPNCFKAMVDSSNCEQRDRANKSQSLSLYMEDGEVAIFPTASETHCNCVETCIVDGVARWNNSQTVLAVVGYMAKKSHLFMVRLVNAEANVLLTVQLVLIIPMEPSDILNTQYKLSSVCWGLQDSAIFTAHGDTLLSIDILEEVPSLQLLCREVLHLNSEKMIEGLPLPVKEKKILKRMRSSLLTRPFMDYPLSDMKCPCKYKQQLLSPNNTRLHCIIKMIRPRVNAMGAELTTYSLNYEHFGDYIPLLQATMTVRRFRQVCYHISPASSEDGIGSASDLFWSNAPRKNIRQNNRRRNSWSSGNTSRLGRFKRAIGQIRRPTSTVLDVAPVQIECDDHAHSLDLQIEDDPFIAELNGNLILNKFKVTKTNDKSLDLARINITNHHLTFDPRDISISLCRNGNESFTNLTSKKPEWNPRFKVYELDFGGRINRDSVKNFQIEENGKIVLQFGRSNFGDYCLDFQQPFSPVTAFSVALSSMESS